MKSLCTSDEDKASLRHERGAPTASDVRNRHQRIAVAEPSRTLHGPFVKSPRGSTTIVLPPPVFVEGVQPWPVSWFFPTLTAAIRAGFEVYARSAEGYLVRMHTARGLVLAIVRLR